METNVPVVTDEAAPEYSTVKGVIYVTIGQWAFFQKISLSLSFPNGRRSDENGSELTSHILLTSSRIPF